MHCNICDRILKEDEISFNPDYQTFDPCGVCLEVIESCFEHQSEEEITISLSEEWPEEFSYAIDDSS